MESMAFLICVDPAASFFASASEGRALFSFDMPSLRSLAPAESVLVPEESFFAPFASESAPDESVFAPFWRLLTPLLTLLIPV